MNSKLEKSVAELNNSLKSEKLIKEYNKLAKQIEESSELKDLENNLKDLQKQLVDTLDKSLMEEHEKVLKQYEELKKTCLDNPLYTNYIEYKDQVDGLLKQIEDILNNI